MILDIGCGADFKGDVNVDLYLEPTIHRPILHKGNLTAKEIPNLIKADAQYLPFTDNSFDLVYSHHLIEHLSNPILFIKECIRVSKREILIICPHRFSSHAKGGGHKHIFNKLWFATVLSKIRRNNPIFYSIETTHNFYLWFRPEDLVVKIIKSSW
jgi:ubiquinone/menaquinone biosynthesis C-methylase UbiE